MTRGLWLSVAFVLFLWTTLLFAYDSIVPAPVFTNVNAHAEKEQTEPPRKLRWGIIADTTQDPIATALVNSEILLASEESEDFEALLSNPSVDAVYIDMPSKHQLTWINKAARAGKHILCNRVLWSYQDVATLCEENKVRLIEAYPFRYQTQLDHVRGMIANGDVDDPVVVRISLSVANDHKEDLWDLACDGINLARELFGSDPIQGMATLIDDPNAPETKAQLCALLSFPGKGMAMLDCNTILNGHYSCEVVGKQSSIRLREAAEEGAFEVEWISDQESVIYVLPIEDNSKGILTHCNNYIAMSGAPTFTNAKILDALKNSCQRHTSCLLK